MKKLLIALFLVPSLGLAAEERAASAPPSGDPMARWVPPKVTNAAKDKQEIQALFRAMESAGKKGDLDAAAALVDFPVTMITDDSKGEAKGEAWDREKWTQVMRPFYEKPMKDMKVTHKPNVFLLSDSLASVDDVCTMTRGGKTITARNSTFVIRTQGQWRVKSMAEGGWGNMMTETPQAAAPREREPSEGTGSAAERPGPQGDESATPGVGSQGTGSDVQGGTEKTTK